MTTDDTTIKFEAVITGGTVPKFADTVPYYVFTQGTVSLWGGYKPEEIFEPLVDLANEYLDANNIAVRSNSGQFNKRKTISGVCNEPLPGSSGS